VVRAEGMTGSCASLPKEAAARKVPMDNHPVFKMSFASAC
jgi:hypothetical protein